MTSEHRTKEIYSRALSAGRVADGSGVGRSHAGFLGTFKVLHSRPAGQLLASQLMYKIMYF